MANTVEFQRLDDGQVRVVIRSDGERDLSAKIAPADLWRQVDAVTQGQAGED